MNGIEILSSETIYNTILPDYWIGIGIFLVFAFLIAAMFCVAAEHFGISALFFVLVVVSIVLGGLGGATNKNSINHIEYKITIDDSVSMNEFLDKYEILDQEGKIYTVKERE